jgi:hypothetical protein
LSAITSSATVRPAAVIANGRDEAVERAADRGGGDAEPLRDPAAGKRLLRAREHEQRPDLADRQVVLLDRPQVIALGQGQPPQQRQQPTAEAGAGNRPLT